MMKKICILILAALLLLSGCGDNSSGRDRLSLWCLSSEPLLPGLRELAREYNSGLERGLLPVEIREFSSEEELARGFETLPPDILLCGSLRAEDLASRGLARDMEAELWGSAPEYPEYLRERLSSAGRQYFPIGGDVLLLCGDRQELNDYGGSLQSLLSRAAEYGRQQRLPYFTADSFSALFYQGLLSRGREFHALRERDIKNPSYTELYNLLAEAAYSGALICSWEAGAELAGSSCLPCAAVFSSTLPPDWEGGLMPLPPMGEDKSLLSRVSGLCVCLRPGREPDSAAAFLSWLFSQGRAGELALSSGLVPLCPAEARPGSALSDCLTEISRERPLHLPEQGADFPEGYGAFESSFRAAMELLG